METLLPAQSTRKATLLPPRPGADSGAAALANEILKGGYAPDPVWVMDICETAEHEYRLLEIGGFSFSNLYAV